MAKSFVLKRWKENALKVLNVLNAKVSPKSSGEEWLSCAEVRSLLSKLIFTHFVSCWNRSREVVEKYNKRLSQDIVDVRIAEQFKA